jgi:dienelactone hydrolase
MRFTSETISDGVWERHFVVGDVPGVLWSPAGAAGASPLVLLGHGGGAHKKAQGMPERARRYVTDCGFAVAAIDAPGYGDRAPTEEHKRLDAAIMERRAAGEPVYPRIVTRNATLATHAVPDWKAVLSALQDADPVISTGRVGYWGLSMGTALGLPFVAADSRVTAAVFGLAGQETLAEAAARITIPVEFVLQWDDELVPRDSGLALFDALGSNEKTLHANPGRHIEVPAFELESSERFFTRHLVGRK